MIIKKSTLQELLTKIETLEKENTILHNEIIIKDENIVNMKNNLMTLELDFSKQEERIDNSNKKLLETQQSNENFKNILIEDIQDIGASTEETSASTEEVSASIEQIKDRVQGAVDNAHENTKVLNHFIKQINELKNDSKNLVIGFQNINKVISVIKNIADQSKMLGLNASIESARAGEYGKGFSVVAREIQNLSETTKRESEEIIKSIQENSLAINELSSIASTIHAETISLIESNSLRLENIKDINENLGEVSIAIQQIAETSVQIATDIQEVSQKL